MVPKSDFFISDKLNPEWSFLGYTPTNLYSLVDKPGWFRLSPKSGKINTITKNDGEHNYSLITRLEFNPKVINDEAGLIIFRGDEKSFLKLYASVDESGSKVIIFSFDTNKFSVENTAGDIIWLKIVRVNHIISGYFSSNGIDWIQVGKTFNISTIDSYSDFSTFTGTRQGLYVRNSTAYFDFYIYRDAYTPILAECPANQYGTTVSAKRSGISSLDNIHDNDWALYAGVEFGNNEYVKSPDSLSIIASCNTAGGIVEVWLDSLDSNSKIAECTINNTGGWTTYKTFTTNLLMPVSGRHDVYVRFKGTGTDKLLMLQWLNFIDKDNPETSIEQEQTGQLPQKFMLHQNYPNPFNPETIISFNLPKRSEIRLSLIDTLGKVVKEVAKGKYNTGEHKITLNISDLASGVYFYKLEAGDFVSVKKLVLVK